MSVVKVIIAMEQGTIPATLHYSTPNKNISALRNGKIQVTNLLLTIYTMSIMQSHSLIYLGCS